LLLNCFEKEELGSTQAPPCFFADRVSVRLVEARIHPNHRANVLLTESFAPNASVARRVSLDFGWNRATVNESPQCTDESNGDCESEFFYANTTQETNGVNASAQPAGELFLNSAFFGFTWENWCDSALGQNLEQCARGSFGILGSK
jgi:hypothetical protein